MQPRPALSPVRGLVVIGIALLLGGGFLVVGFDDANPDADSNPISFGDDDDGGTSDTTAAPAAAAEAPASVAVYVANGSGVGGQGGLTTDKLRAAGYTAAIEPGDGTVTPTSQVYFLPEHEPAAQAVATALGLTPDRVVAWPTPPPFVVPPEATVIVLSGTDLVTPA
jgi:hypothetical protein